MPAVEGAHWHRQDRTKQCIMCGESKPLSEFGGYSYTTRQGKSSTRYESRCPPCNAKRRAARYAANPGLSRQQHQDWKMRNRSHVSEYNRKRQQDPAHRALKAYHQRLREARLRSGSRDTPEIRAIYAKAMQEEALIQNCPVFDLPELGKKLHVDHIIPLRGKFVSGLHVPQNLQIIPIGINMRKGTQCRL